MATLHFKAKLQAIGSWTILKLDKSVSEKLTSRGLTMIEGTINGHRFQTALEPDGKGSHWFGIDSDMQKSLKVKAGDTLELEIEQTNNWSEPKVPLDLQSALAATKIAQETWKDVTPMARWEWTRWINGTKNPVTRKRRIEVALSKLNAGKRRPCCFNTSQCTVQEVSNNGVLLDS